jgi:type I restriction enzyme, S subunit
MWHTKKLNEVCDIQSGLWKGKKGPYTTALVLRNTNFTASGVFDYSNVVELEVEAKQLANREVIKNDIILEKSGGGDKTPVGRVCIHDKESKIPFSLSNFTARIRVLDSKELNAEFLHKFLYFLYISGKTEPMQRHSTGIRNLQLTQYKDIDVPLPPLLEQERIVAKLDAAFAEIDEAVELTALKKEEINNFKCSILDINNKKNDFFNSALNNWEELKIGEICDLMTGGTPSRKVPEYFDNGEIKWLVSGDINKKEIFDCNGRITEEGFANSSAKFLPENSVLIALNGQGRTRGTVAMLKTKATCNQSLVSIFPKSGVNLNTKYLYYFLEGMYDKIRRITGDSGNDRRGLNMPLIRNIKILLPPITEQEKIISKLEMAINKLDIANKAIDKVIENYKALKSIILSKELQSNEAA